MSRVARNPVVVPNGVQITLDAENIKVKGPLGELSQALTSRVKVNFADNQLTFEATSEEREARAMSGTLRALINNMVIGVTKGFERKLLLVGVGYRAQVQGTDLNLSLGYSHPILHKMPAGVEVTCPTQTEIVLKSINKQLVGQVAAEVRKYRQPEPYKGKGVRYSDEVVILKETKKK